MPTGYEDLDNLQNQTNQLYDQQMEQQKNIVNTSTQQAIDEIERNKKKAEDEALKTNKALYADYQKQVNPYGVNAENLAEQGLNKSGLAETTKANYYNTYQNARTQAQNNANTIKADFDVQITKARQNGDLQLAQAALNMYQQKVNDMYNLYNLKFNQDQFSYQKEQNVLSQENWQKEYEQALQQAQWQQAFNQAQFDYQKERDAIEDDQWRQQFELSKKASSSGRGGSSSGSRTIEPTETTTSSGSTTINPATKGIVTGALEKTLANYRDNVASMVANGQMSVEEARDVFNKLGL